MKDPLHPYGHVMPKSEEQGFFRKLGGGALSIAVLFHVILAILGAIWIAQRIYQSDPPDDFMPGNRKAGGGERVATSPVSQKAAPQITPSADVKRVFADGANSSFSLPDPGDNFAQMPTLVPLGGGGMPGGLGGAGSGRDFGSGEGPSIRIGDMASKPFAPLPAIMRKRCSKEDRLARLEDNGGNPVCEEAVLKGLRWLKANQNPDGSWGPQKNAMTGLVLLAYFGHCETPSTFSEEFGESCLNGIVYLVNVGIKNKGVLTDSMTGNAGPYEHAIATYSLGEAATFCKELKIEIPSLMEVTEKAGQFIIDNQHGNGGWAYGYAKTDNAHTDTSVVGWQLQALKACSHTNIQYKGMNACVKNGLAYLAGLQAENGSFGYNRPGGKALTGVGVLCHQMWGKERSKEVRNGLKFIKDNFKLDWNSADSDLYSHYYASQAMMQAGGSYWKSYNSFFRDQLLKNQNPDGSWKAPAFTGHGQSPGNAIYRNALCVLMLEVYYRFLATSGSKMERSGI